MDDSDLEAVEACQWVGAVFSIVCGAVLVVLGVASVFT